MEDSFFKNLLNWMFARPVCLDKTTAFVLDTVGVNIVVSGSVVVVDGPETAVFVYFAASLGAALRL